MAVNIEHSIFQRLLNRAREKHEDFNLILLRYGMERFLYRLSISNHREQFILKGASLFLAWKQQSYRVTKDADFLGLGSANESRLVRIFREISQCSCDQNDGVVFLKNSVRGEPIHEEKEHAGVRILMIGLLN